MRSSNLVSQNLFLLLPTNYFFTQFPASSISACIKMLYLNFRHDLISKTTFRHMKLWFEILIIFNEDRNDHLNMQIIGLRSNVPQQHFLLI